MNGLSRRRLFKITLAVFLSATIFYTSRNASAQAVLTTATSAPQLGEATVAPGTPIAISTTVVDQKGAAVSTGTVTFCEEAAVNRDLLRQPCGHYPLATAQVTKSGVAVSSIRLPIGAVKVVAVYAGTKTLKGSVSPSTVATVSGLYPTTTSLAYSGPATGLTLTASVTTPASFIPGYLSVRDLTSGQPLFSFPGQVTTNYSFHSLGADVPMASVLQTATKTVDLNNDGFPDLVCLDGQQGLNFYFNERGKTLTRAKAGPAASSPGGFTAMGIADFNADDVPDLILYDEGTNTFDIYYGNGNGSFPSKPSVQLSFGYNSSGNSIGPGSLIYTADFNEDGTIDFAFDDGGQFVVVPNLGDGTFGKPIFNSDGSTQGDGGENAVLVVTSSDGHTDVAMPGDFNELFFLKGHGDGTFTATQYPLATPYNLSIAVVNFGPGGFDDIFLGSYPNYSADSPDQVGDTNEFAGDGKGGLQGGAGPVLPYSATDVLGLPYGLLATDNFGNYTLLHPDMTMTTFVIPQVNNNQQAFQDYPLVAAGDFNASGLMGFVLDTGELNSPYYDQYTGMQTYAPTATSTMTIQQSGFSFKNADTLLGLYHPGGNAAFVSSDSKTVQAPAATQ